MKKFFISLLAIGFLGLGFAQNLTIWTHFGDAELDWLQDQATSFENVFGTPVEIVKIDLGEIKQKMLLSAPEGEAADLIVPIPHDQIGEMAVGGVLADMSGFATDSYLEDLNTQAQLAFSFNGKLFGLPMYVEGPALIVNTDLVPNLPTNFEDMMAQAQKLTTDDGFGFLYDIGNFYFSYVWLHSNGGYVFGRDSNSDLVASDIGLDNNGAITGAELMKKFRFDYGLIPTGVDYGVADGQFSDGSLAMTYNGPWAIANYKDAGINLKVMPVPAMKDGTEFSGFMGVQGILMNQFSTNKLAAANFAKWLTRPQAQISLALLTGKIPSSNAAAAKVADDPIIAGFSAALANAEPMPNIPEMGNIWGPMGDALTVLLDSQDSNVSEILHEAVKQIKGQ
ncbi:MAG TPA: maltose ABC transporter substrate-binding protein [Trueperaceae bacterium]|nr:maltose ABC transporter substrate-binding protein [Trueperaceae bacterium]